MTNRGIRGTIVFFLLMAFSWPVHAWNDIGHMAVAYVAYQKLTPATKDRVKALLALNPYAKTKWKSILKTVQAKDKDLAIFMIAATWPDQIKSDNKTYHDDGTQGGDRPPTDGTADNNIGYTDTARHKYWHFVDTPFSNDGTALPALPTPNAQMRIGDFRKVLASTSSDDLKSYDLSWLLHLIGDVHQPLHAATRVSKIDTAGDNGGNSVKVTCSTCTSTMKLHAFWDGLLGAGNSVDTAIQVAKKLADADAAAAAKSSEKDWCDESFSAAQTSVYKNPPIGSDHGPFTTTTSYKNAAKKLAKERVALAGARLANLLTNELK
ncbi:MAG: S1/P1 nuclease [Deltaproteobacteria bacterium]|nr:S1/P1 nuclease [Deltaproteobacteria bacterium]